MTKLLSGLMLLAACAQAQTVEGTVVNSLTGSGIPAAQVHLGPVSGEKDYSATTDALGHFLIKDVNAGTYNLFYISPGYLQSDFGRRVQITADGNPKLEGRMTPQPRISGRVVDANGDGIAHALVEVIPQGSGMTTTDATGKFELHTGQPGSYILSAVAPIGLKPPDPEPDSGRVMVWTRTFYPGVPFLEAASRIVVPPGRDASGIEIKLLAVPAHAIRGVLLNLDGTPVPKTAIALEEGPRERWAVQPAPRVESNADGVFEFPRVVDGEWRLAVEVGKVRAAQWIEMAGRDQQDVKLRLASPFTVPGQVVMDTPQGMKGPDPFAVFLVPRRHSIHTDTGMSNWMLWPALHFEPPIPRNVPDAAAVYNATKELTTTQFVEQGAILATPQPDGSFSLEDVYPGSYRIVSLPPPPPYYMASIRVGQADLTTAEVEISSGAAPITVVFKTDGGSIRGTVDKCDSGMVLLIPQDPALQSLGFLRSARCDSGDRYEFTAVRPGDYYTLAFAGKLGIPQLDDILISQAGKITVHAGDPTSADLRPIPRPGY